MKQRWVRWAPLVVLWLGMSWAQDRPAAVQRGVQLFYEARFAEASTTLQEAIASGRLSREARFDAYLYLGFSILRGGGPVEAAEIAFEACVRGDPTRTLDRNIIPPDLVERFEQVRQRLVGKLFVVSHPREAGVFAIHEDSGQQIVGKTPVLFEHLLAGPYRVRLTKEGFGQEMAVAEVRPGAIDTLFVDLREAGRPHKSSARRWIVAGALTASLLVVLLSLVQRGSGS
ncbi:MAG: PEGA domain-containing protein [candidate division KSB1 bacterium]|nr:PEGA domain-containing protein [candidate division KSB1 bacterium]